MNKEGCHAVGDFRLRPMLYFSLISQNSVRQR
jgi:hypothetical protein